MRCTVSFVLNYISPFQALVAVPENSSVEWMIHPGNICCCKTGDNFAKSEDRVLEKELLKSKEFMKKIDDLGFIVCSFEEI